MTSKGGYSLQSLVAVSLLALVVAGCSSRKRLPYYESAQKPAGTYIGASEDCRTPAAGCPCSEPGAIVECGEVKSQVDEYVTCTEGVRLCSSEHVWGDCSGTEIVRTTSDSATVRTQGLGSASDCSDVNPCDPLCREIVDTASGLTNLPKHLCATPLGLQSCDSCGYERPTTNLAYSAIPKQWQAIIASCTTANDRCVMDTHCVDGSCVEWSDPCQSTDGACGVDLTLGQPCVGLNSPETSFHIPVCNRGTTRLDTGTIRIGVDSRTESLTRCVSSTASDFPDSGHIDFILSAAQGQYIEPGRCIDVNVDNSQTSGLDFSGDRSLVVNSNAAIAECNRCNDSNVVIRPTATDNGSICADCSSFTCAQTNAKTTLRGVVYDPIGRTPIPNVTVYVPNNEVTQLSVATQATCDTCESLISGSPIAIVLSDARGRFTLPNVPVDTRFPLVVQTGRWRRQFTIGAIPAGATRWVGDCTAGTNTAGNSSGDCSVVENEPGAVVTAKRLRLPRTQRRCAGKLCGGEGDIPKIALIMADADPLQCLLRRIGVAESEMTASSGPGRIHLFNHNGMQIADGQNGFGDGGLLEDAEQLKAYAALLAPCDYNHNTVFDSPTDSYTGSIYRSGPSYNSPPNPTASLTERANVKAYLDEGGRLFTSHWLSMDFIHLNYSPPEPMALGDYPLLSPYDPTNNTSFESLLTTLTDVGFEWKYEPVAEYNPTAPVVHLFGRAIESGSNTKDPQPPYFWPRYPHFDYTIDQSSQLGTDLATWADAVGASIAGEPGKLRFQSWSSMARSVRPDLGVSRLAYGNSTDVDSFYYEGMIPGYVPRPQTPCVMYGDSVSNPDHRCTAGGKYWGDEHVALYQFDTPLESTDKCGRVVAAQSHVTKHACKMPSVQPRSCAGDGSSTDCNCVTLPTASEWARGCGDSATALNALKPDELAFEYLLFSTTQCLGAVVAPKRSITLPTVTFVRTFEADCEADEQPLWQLFSLQATIPDGTSIVVTAATADSEQSLVDGDADWVSVGTFTSSTSTWTSSAHTLDWYFRNQLRPEDVSRRWLKVNMTLTPSGGVSPTVSEWRAVFNCVPAK